MREIIFIGSLHLLFVKLISHSICAQSIFEVCMTMMQACCNIHRSLCIYDTSNLKIVWVVSVAFVR